MLLVLVALVGLWDDALVAGSALLLIGYVVSLSTGHRPYDSVAPLVAAALATLVDLGSWSLELREGPESATLHHVRTLLAIAIGALATGAAVFAAGNTRAGGGIALWLIGAAAAAGLLAIIRAHRATASLPSRRKSSFQAGSG